MKNLFKRWLTGLEKVYQAKTEEEKEAVYRLRYRVFVDELNKEVINADHRTRQIRDPEDAFPNTTLLYTVSNGSLTGALRVTLWQPEAITRDLSNTYSLHLFPDIQNHTISEVSRLVASAQSRGQLVLPALARACYDFVAGENGCHFGFSFCAPGLVRPYRRLGYRPYNASMISTADGLRVPLIMITSDRAYFQEVNSPLSPFVSTYFGSGRNRIPPLDLSAYRKVLGESETHIKVKPEQVWQQIQSELSNGNQQAFSLMENLTEREVRKLAEQGMILQVQPYQTVTREDLHEREMFVILDGVFVVFSGDRRLAMLHKGDVFGEVALLLDNGRRMASIRALNRGKLLVLRRKFIEDMMDREPKIAAKLLFNISRIMAQRFVSMIKPDEPQVNAADANLSP
ncbi:cyclic nucleotide-binding domain-containing protein [Acanthopleuribacter pedis]|uniref:Cyclic nucleotide-binding domain-containing protein n=1 Tax=Acanthopleuribacter pedis TaxID=442870 RepID=A0A8J7U5V4_9BACT|nr:cyclic nucleotide-binding domain-containing protein [Acanthopleuribacter pedis]MBO1319701.1 cyclic nucleotide-binding domain-containing protein [Acanthopleuribacter pedis]